MTTFFQGPSLLTHAILLGLLAAVLVPLVFRRTDSVALTLLAFILTAAVYAAVALWRAAPRRRP